MVSPLEAARRTSTQATTMRYQEKFVQNTMLIRSNLISEPGMGLPKTPPFRASIRMFASLSTLPDNPSFSL